MKEETVSTSKAAAMLGMSYIRLWRAIESGLIEATRQKTPLDKRGTNYRIPMSEIERLQQEMGIVVK